MKTIVAATDFSPISENAVRYAADLAVSLGTRLALIHVYTIPVVVGDMPIPANSLKEAEANTIKQLETLRDNLTTRTGTRIEIRLVARPGDVVRQLEDYCNEIKPYAVVLGSESAKGFERLLFGGKVITALKKIKWPLLIVPPGVKFTQIRKIGLACDLKEVVDSVRVQEIKDLLNVFRAELYVLHVMEESADAYTPETVEQSGLLHEMLEKLDPKYHFLRDTEIEKGISEYAETNNIDLVIIIPKRHTLLSEIAQHRHSKRLVLHTHVPIMSLHE